MTLKLKDVEPYKKFYPKESELNSNPIGTFTSRVWQYHEHECLMVIKHWFEKNGKPTQNVPSSLIHDGLHVTRTTVGNTEPLPVAMLRTCEARVLKKTTLVVQLVEKSLKPTKKDIEWYWGAFSLAKLHGDDRPKYLLSRSGQLGKFKRLDGWVLKPHPNIPGAMKRDVEAEPFINQVLVSDHGNLHSYKMETLVTWFNKIQDPMFPLMDFDQFDRYVISFQDGYYHLKKNIFTPWTAENRADPPITNNFFDCPYPTDTDTPIIDKIITRQIDETETAKWFWCLVFGRPYYKVGELDNWQVAPYIKGDANTGKSTIGSIIVHAHPPGTLGVVASNFEKTFGLENLYNKRVVLFPDMSKRICDALNQDLFQSMITGEEIPIARKNKGCIPDFLWSLHLIMFSNHWPGYGDDSGSISRRCVTFLFETLIPETERDTEMGKKMLELELPKIMIKLNRIYLEFAHKYKGRSFWDVCPKQLVANQNNVRVQTNYLADFLVNESPSKFQEIPFGKFT